MIEYSQGNLLEADVEALVNSINCVGSMGRGIALQFKQAWPNNFKEYVKACRQDLVRPGHLLVFEMGVLGNPRSIINFPTKRHWRGKALLRDIEAGLVALRTEILQREICSLALPPLGCGLGGLDWEEVRKLIEKYLGDLPGVRVLLYRPQVPTPLPSSMKGGPVPRMTPGRAAMLGVIERYLQAMMDFEVTLLEVQKLLYFLQEGGEPLRLRFVAGPYGPDAENLRHVL